MVKVELSGEEAEMVIFALAMRFRHIAKKSPSGARLAKEVATRIEQAGVKQDGWGDMITRFANSANSMKSVSISFFDNHRFNDAS